VYLTLLCHKKLLPNVIVGSSTYVHHTLLCHKQLLTILIMIATGIVIVRSSTSLKRFSDYLLASCLSTFSFNVNFICNTIFCLRVKKL